MVAVVATAADSPQDDATAVRVFAGTLDVPERQRARLAELLSVDEHARARRLVLDRDRRRFVVARARLRMILGRALDIAPEAVRFRVEPGGKPVLARTDDAGAEGHDPVVAFNLSHAADVVLVAVGRGGRIGVDIESVDPAFDTAGLERTCLTAQERALLAGLDAADRSRAFLQSWTRKEAYLKAVGMGLAVPLQAVSIEPRPGTPPLTSRVTGAGAGAGTEWHVHDLAVSPGYVAALALDAPRPVSACRWIDD